MWLIQSLADTECSKMVITFIFIITTKKVHPVQGIQGSWFWSENLKNGKELAEEGEGRNSTYRVWKKLEGQEQFSKKVSLSNLFYHQRLTRCQKDITNNKENFMPGETESSVRNWLSHSAKLGHSQCINVFLESELFSLFLSIPGHIKGCVDKKQTQNTMDSPSLYEQVGAAGPTEK